MRRNEQHKQLREPSRSCFIWRGSVRGETPWPSGFEIVNDAIPTGKTRMANSELNSVLPVAETVASLRQWVAESRGRGDSIGFVPTMGALHAGHASLISTAAAECDFVVVSVFVNPTQFGPNEDLARYPRTFATDREVCGRAGAKLIFFPSVAEMYPEGFATVVSLPTVSEALEGTIRPGHFPGVATVVLKLLNIVQADRAYFGAKDFQQQWLVRQMVRDLNQPGKIVTCETVREADGLALSSRNRYLSPEQRQQAIALSQALFWAASQLKAGASDLDELRWAMRQMMETAGLTVDYTAIRDRESFQEQTAPVARMVLLVAARLGTTRLIDNVWVDLSQLSQTAGSTSKQEIDGRTVP